MKVSWIRILDWGSAIACLIIGMRLWVEGTGSALETSLWLAGGLIGVLVAWLEPVKRVRWRLRKKVVRRSEERGTA